MSQKNILELPSTKTELIFSDEKTSKQASYKVNLATPQLGGILLDFEEYCPQEFKAKIFIENKEKLKATYSSNSESVQLNKVKYIPVRIKTNLLNAALQQLRSQVYIPYISRLNQEAQSSWLKDYASLSELIAACVIFGENYNYVILTVEDF